MEYKTLIWRKNGIYYGQVREISILARGDDPADVLGKVEAAKEELFQTYREAGLGIEEAPPPIGTESWRRWQSLSWFAAKAAVITFAASILIVVTLSQAANSVRGVIVDAFDATGGPYAMVGNLARYVDGFPAERRAKTQRNLEIIVKALLPYAETIHPLFGPACDSTGARPAAKGY